MKKKECIIAIGFFSFVTLIFFYKVFFGLIPFPGDLLVSEYQPWKTYSYEGYTPGGVPSKAQYFDTLRQMYPWRTLANTLIEQKVFPLWNPYNFSGAPFFANVQSAVLYPLNVLYIPLPQETAWTILTMVSCLLCSIFFYLYARKIGITHVSSLFASIAFSYCLFLAVFLEYNTINHVIMWLPLSLWSIESYNKSSSLRYLVILFLSSWVIFFAGHLQIAGVILCFVAVYAVMRKQNRLLHVLILFLSAVSAGIQLVPVGELLQLSARASQEYRFLIQTLLLQPYQLILFFMPDIFGNPATRNYLINDTYPGNAIYIGLVPFFFALYAFVYGYKKWYVAFFGVVAFTMLLFLIRSPFTELFYKYPIPIITTSSPTNMLFIVSFSLAVVAGFGLDIWREKTKKPYALIGLFLFVSILSWALFLTPLRSVLSSKNILYSTIITTILIIIITGSTFFKKRTVIACFLLCITILDLAYFFNKFNPFVHRAFVFPEAPIATWLQKKSGVNRVWEYGSASIESNFHSHLSLFSPNGYDPLYPRRYGELIYSAQNGKLLSTFTNRTRSDAILAPASDEDPVTENKYRLHIINMLGIKYILYRGTQEERAFPREKFEKIYQEDGWSVFENKDALPRAFLTYNYTVFHSSEEFEKNFFTAEDPKQVFLEEDIGKLNAGKYTEAKIVTYTPSVINVETNADENSLLFLSDTFYPGWRVSVDGTSSKLLRANYTFRGVVVPKGKHMVTFSYMPDSFFTGIKTSIIGVLLFIGILIYIRMRKKHE